MRFDKVFTSIWSVILLWNLVNAKATTERRHESSSTEPTSILPLRTPSKELNRLPAISISIDLTPKRPLHATSRVPQRFGQQQISNSEEPALRISAEFISGSEPDNEQNNLINHNSGMHNVKDQLVMAPKVKGEHKELDTMKQLSSAKENVIINHVTNAVAHSVPKWQYGIVPYRIDENTFDDLLKVHLKKAMDIIEKASCVRFKEVMETSNGMTWLHFMNPDRTRECVHTTTQGDSGDVVVTLGLECMKTRDLLHSILHGLGFIDEVTHPHRDQYIRIIWENIQPKYRSLFTISREGPDKLVEYDPMSIMHFHDRAYSGNGGLTITPVMYGLVINPSDKLSQLDVMKLRLAFGHECNKRNVGDIVQNCKNVMYKKNVGGEDKDNDSEKDSGNEKDSGSKKDSGSEKDSGNEKDNGNEQDSGNKKDSGNEKDNGNEQDSGNKKDNGNEKDKDNGDDSEIAVRHSDVDVSTSNEAGDDLQARRFPSHLKFKNKPPNNIH